MSSPENERREGVDFDKLVTRLLDIIQQQQAELAKHRTSSEAMASSQTEPKQPVLPPRQPEMVQVSELRQFVSETPVELPQIPGPVDLRSTLKQSSVFLAFACLALIGTLVFAFKPQPPEIARLSAQIAKQDQALREKDAEQSRLVTAHIGEVVDLQQKLKDTQDALSQNEKALIEEQAALRQLTQGPSTDPAAPSAKASIVHVDQAAEAKSSIARVRTDLNKTRSDLFNARRSYIDNVRAVAQNRLALFTIQGAEDAMNPAAEHKAMDEKTWRDFVDPEAQPFVDAKAEDLPQYELTGEPASSSVEDLRNFEKKELAMLRKCLADLRTFQDRILEKQNELTSVEMQVKMEEAKLLELQNTAKHAVAAQRNSKPLTAEKTQQELNAYQH